ncbi:hypothetical protein [Streptomyces lunalinharesii]|uniref:Uncharacterized protein n=1 Tax=Streptomyces lunalinharesii TaxID=333384 RepID=A0ABN3S982_9ACTN
MKRTTWPYAVTAIVALAIQTGWAPQDVLPLVTTLLILIGLVISIDNTPPQ